MRFFLSCFTCLLITAVAPAQTTNSAIEYVDSYRQLSGSLDRCQDALSRISGLERELDHCGPNPAPNAARRIIHELAGEIAALRSECRQIRPAIALGRQALQRASETLGEKAAESNRAAAGTTEDVIKQQQLSLSRQYGFAAETMSKLCKEWEAAAKKLDRGATFLAQAASVTLQWEKLTDLMPVIASDENSQAAGQAKSIARAVAERFDLLSRLKDGLPRLKAALSLLGYSLSAASDASMPQAAQLPRAWTSKPGAAPKESPVPATPRGIRRSTTVEELTRAGWLTVYPPK